MSHAKPLARRPRARLAGDRETRALVALLGGEVKRARLALQLTQQELADRVGISRARLAEIERGEGHSAPFGTRTSLGIALGRPLAVSFTRPLGVEEPRDAGHLGAEEHVLGRARRVGRDRSLELSVGSGWRPRAIDVVQRDRPQRTLILNEIWNRMDDFGGAIRNHDLKVADLERLAVVAGGEGAPYRVAACWILRATAANRALVARYPEIIRTRFPGSSRAWVRCLERGDPAPQQPGIVWIDLNSTRLFEVRLPVGR